MLPSQRRRAEEFSAREAAGESVWVDQFDRKALVRIAELWRIIEGDVSLYGAHFSDEVGRVLRRGGGWPFQRFGPDQLASATDHDLILDAIAAGLVAANKVKPQGKLAANYQKLVNFVLNEHRIAHKFVDGELIPFKSDELLQEVVEPTLRLLVGAEYKGAHDAYLKALKEISQNEAADAITDAGAALQQTLTALGWSGNSLGRQIADARKNGLLAGHDQQLADGILKFADWASADRSESGDAHKTSNATTADAWLMVHVVGALIVRLVDPSKRGE
ncbi:MULTISPECIES: hypothetical protein [unclassified Nocardioides]|uniref:hypothetical protein n=1 Tax=unclassified Nocardioides TaxID=2615069 RepID=UPI00360F6656